MKDKVLLLIGVFLLLGGLFGFYMQLSGEDSGAWVSATLMSIFGVLFLIVGIGIKTKKTKVNKF